MFAALVLCAGVYWPGLHGGFLFDDFPNIVDNNAVHIDVLNWHQLHLAADASPSQQLKRPLAMLSFAIDEYFTGNDPLPMKVTNLAIHLVNGGLLFLALSSLFRVYAQRRKAIWSPEWLACAVASAWLLLPINLTGVIYVVQRMESLCQLCVLVGLWQYFRARELQIAGKPGMLRAGTALVLGTCIGLLFKESAVLLPLYALISEWTVLKFKVTNRVDGKRLVLLYILVLLLPGIAGLCYLMPRVLSPAAYATRPFTLDQRLLTESRLLFDYLHWTLLPNVTALGFYHDDIATSTSLLKPPTTLVSLISLLGLLVIGIICNRKLPLLTLGIFWFFSAHLLTATVIPLELVYEHRNYFASIGALLAVSALILELLKGRAALRITLAVAACGLYALATASRAYDWGDPIRFAEAEAAHHPNSPRAQYELGRVLVIATDYKTDSPMVKPAYEVLERARLLPGSSALSESALILLASQLHQPVKSAWWQSMTKKLKDDPISEEDISALKSLANCQKNENCTLPATDMLKAFLGALSHEPVNSRLLADYSDYVSDQLHDYKLSESLLRESISKTPQQSGMRIALADVLLKEGKKAAAAEQVQMLERIPLDDFEMRQLIRLQKALR